jgi:hypothetical protein
MPSYASGHNITISMLELDQLKVLEINAIWHYTHWILCGKAKILKK